MRGTLQVGVNVHGDLRRDEKENLVQIDFVSLNQTSTSLMLLEVHC